MGWEFLPQVIYIVAPNYYRFMKYCNEKGLKPGNTARFINRPDDVFGIRGAVEFAEGFYLCEKYLEISHELRAKAVRGDVSLPDWWLSTGGAE